MRHRVKGRKLSRTTSHRKATLRSLATALFMHKKIKTTVAKAKHAKTFIEPLITKAKVDSVASRRHVDRYIKDKDVLKELFTEIMPKIGDRPGGYTRVIKLGTRPGDAAEMAILELVDFAEGAERKSAPVKVEESIIEDATVVEEVVEKIAAEEETVVEETEAPAEEAVAEEKPEEAKESSDDDKSEEKEKGEK